MRRRELTAFHASFLLLASGLCASAQGVQHWGFGHGSLATLQTREDGSRDLVVYEAPLRAKDAAWLVRWRSEKIAGPQAAAWVACGDFKPQKVGKAYVVVATADGAGLTVTLYDPPEVFTTRAWAALPAKNRLIPAEKLGGTVEHIAAGNLYGSRLDPDGLCVLIRSGEGDTANWFVGQVRVPMDEKGEAELTRREPLPVKADPSFVAGFAVGDFWGTGEDSICFPIGGEAGTQLKFLRWGREVSPGACFVKVVDDIAQDVPPLATGGICAADYLKDGFDAITLLPADPEAPMEVRVAPAREPGKGREPGPFYNGHMPSRQAWPGFGGYMSVVSMRGRPEGLDKRKEGPLPIAGGPVFGYVRGTLDGQTRAANVLDERGDAGIACAHRIAPWNVGEGEPHFGWPLQGEETSWQIVVKNNGKHEVAGGGKLRVWLCTDKPNADLTGVKPDMEMLVERMEAENADKPDYKIFTVKGPWPWALVDCPGEKWKRLNLGEVGERWLIATIEAPGDVNERDNRLEVPWHGLPYHPILRDWGNLRDSRPMVPGDPPGLEYLMRKTADAVNATWARAGGAYNEDALIRVFFDGFDVGWPDDVPEREKERTWRAYREKYEGLRQLESHWGGDWERLDWKGPEKPEDKRVVKDPLKDTADELKEVARLFHPLAGIDEGKLSPSLTGIATLGDGRPVQMTSRYWTADILTTGHRVAGVPAAEYARRYMQGVRGVKLPAWSEMAPDKVIARVLDRDGNPVSGATVTLWLYGKTSSLRSGTTDSAGRWDTGHPFGPGAPDMFGKKHWTDGLQVDPAAILVVTIGFHSEAFLLGADDAGAHGRLALFLHSMTDPREWVTNLRLNWHKNAAPPDFTIDLPVQGTMVELQVNGTPGRKYRLYRRWEPAWIRTLVGEYPTGDGKVVVPLELTAPDSWGKGRFRASYEVTCVDAAGNESLPRFASATALQNVLGLSLTATDRLSIAAGNGDADPFGIELKYPSTSLHREMLLSTSREHAARKIVRSNIHPLRLFVTLKASGELPPVCLDILDSWQGGPYERKYDLGTANGKRGGPKEFRVRNPTQLGELNQGDVITWNTKSARVASIQRECVFLDAPIFDMEVDQVTVQMTRAAGRLGENSNSRELCDPRGLMILPVGKEHVAIADTGNNRIVVWDDTTKFVSYYGGDKFRPCALGLDPRDSKVFFVVDRRPDRKSFLLRLTFGGKTIERDHKWNLDAGDWNGEEQGLAVRRLYDELDRVQLAVTDAEKGRVLLFTVMPDHLVANGVVKIVTGTHAGPLALQAPSDCIFVPGEKNAARLFLVDGMDRVVEGGASVPK
ncbi:MAG: hypothetical protein AAB074_01610 [Planctomycetota bacterium]